jgi:hypothetical protein
MSSEQNPRAAVNIPLAAYVTLGITYLLLMIGLALFTVGDGPSWLVWVVATLGASPLIILPIYMMAMDKNYVRSTMDQFLEFGINTPYGNCGGKAAMVQMMVVPTSIVLGLLLMLILV